MQFAGGNEHGSAYARDIEPRVASAIIVDPDREYAEIIRDTLRRSTEDVRLTTSAQDAFEWLRQETHGLLVVDHAASAPSGQPGQSETAGPEAIIAIIRIVRHLQPSIGIVVTVPDNLLSAERVACFDAGADQVIQKPFYPSEFLARSRALLSRVARYEAARQQIEFERRIESKRQGERATSAGLEIGEGGARYNGRHLDLTATEWVLLRELYEARGWVLTYEALNARVFGTSGEAGAARLKSHISALRQKLRDAGADPDIVRNTRGTGYVLLDRHAPESLRSVRERWTVHTGGRA